MPWCWAFVVTSWPRGAKWQEALMLMENGGGLEDGLRMWCCGAVFCLLVGRWMHGLWALEIMSEASKKRVAKRCHILQHCNEGLWWKVAMDFGDSGANEASPSPSRYLHHEQLAECHSSRRAVEIGNASAGRDGWIRSWSGYHHFQHLTECSLA